MSRPQPRCSHMAMADLFSRASQTHQVPQVGLPNRLPVARQTAVKLAPTGPISTSAVSANATTPAIGELHTASEKYPAPHWDKVCRMGGWKI